MLQQFTLVLFIDEATNENKIIIKESLEFSLSLVPLRRIMEY
jgi:hypothetical protein